jgi:hypothetical protein
LVNFLLGQDAISFNMSITASNVGRALRQVNATVPIGGVDTSASGVNPPYGYALTSATLSSADGSARVAFDTRVPTGSGGLLGFLGGLLCSLPLLGIDLCYEYTISIPMALLSDHPVVDPLNATTNWFFRNRWHELSLYTIAAGVAPSQATPRGCVPPACLQVSNLPTTIYADNAVRGAVFMPGRSLVTPAKPAGQMRPSTDLLDWFEDANAIADGSLGTPYTARGPGTQFNRTFNDRVIVIDHN